MQVRTINWINSLLHWESQVSHILVWIQWIQMPAKSKTWFLTLKIQFHLGLHYSLVNTAVCLEWKPEESIIFGLHFLDYCCLVHTNWNCEYQKVMLPLLNPFLSIPSHHKVLIVLLLFRKVDAQIILSLRIEVFFSPSQNYRFS